MTGRRELALAAPWPMPSKRGSHDSLFQDGAAMPWHTSEKYRKTPPSLCPSAKQPRDWEPRATHLLYTAPFATDPVADAKFIIAHLDSITSGDASQ